jgi:predicted nucleic acid-binding protein
MFLLDTNVISELRQGKPRQSASVRRWAAAQPMNQLFLSVITILELEKGILALERKTPPQGAGLREWLQGLRAGFAGRVLPFTEQAAVLCAAMHVPNPRSERDALIAATAREHHMVVVTRNVRDFEGTGVQVFNPFAD